ncbi:hypothetical protein SCHPADRAFT_51402 [Schizopora paradoxa]|uniref:DUF6533 domain-containing protein n=1 Tax=Schizopora paradoxa TaxID=27342 RepID=A0A0H2S602_9AGAM|nr:hypothetical protein SCHPADRAFT_51402 [Schizopora paradoxa]
MLDLPLAVASAVPGLYSEGRVVDYAGIAAAVWTAYDIVITFGDEVEHIWGAPWSLAKTCYVFSRYFGAFAVQLIALEAPTKWLVTSVDISFNGNLCTGISLFKAITGLLLGLSVEVVMLLRVHALYGSRRRILLFLATAYIIEFTTASTIIALTLREILYSSGPVVFNEIPMNAPLTGCNPISVPSYFSLYWLALLSFQSILFVMMAVNMIRSRLAWRGLEGIGRARLLTIFFRDGTVFYALNLATLLANLAFCKISNSPVSQLGVCLHLSVLSVSCSRLILNMRTLTGNATHGMSCEATLETICFRKTIPQNIFEHSTTGHGHSHGWDEIDSITVRPNKDEICP